jgi:nicotinate-nucleotide--dimethylbenzimidazole phosphoribosyltransferase|nr:nicotinate-nucleotide--dimethylbenzimidazole phosphoribosyltransferase [Kofleriaceae bacterium]
MIAASIEPADAAAAAAARARFADDPTLAAVAAAVAAAQHGVPRARHRTLLIGDGEPTAAACQAAAIGRAQVLALDASYPDEPVVGAAVVVGVAELGLDVLLLGGDARVPLLTGAILAAASLRAVIVLDGDATGAAALAAIASQPLVRGYLVAAHRGNRHLAALGLEPIFDVGLGRGDGAGAAMLLPLLDRVG